MLQFGTRTVGSYRCNFFCLRHPTARGLVQPPQSLKGSSSAALPAPRCLAPGNSDYSQLIQSFQWFPNKDSARKEPFPTLSMQDVTFNQLSTAAVGLCPPPSNISTFQQSNKNFLCPVLSDLTDCTVCGGHALPSYYTTMHPFFTLFTLVFGHREHEGSRPVTAGG